MQTLWVISAVLMIFAGLAWLWLWHRKRDRADLWSAAGALLYAVFPITELLNAPAKVSMAALALAVAVMLIAVRYRWKSAGSAGQTRRSTSI